MSNEEMVKEAVEEAKAKAAEDAKISTKAQAIFAKGLAP